VRHLLPLLLLLAACGGGADEPPPGYTQPPEYVLGVIAIENHSADAYDCVRIVMDGEVWTDRCGPMAILPGDRAAATYYDGRVYEVTLSQHEGPLVVSWPPFVLDGEEVLVID
jgi:hypothetical protein